MRKIAIAVASLALCLPVAAQTGCTPGGGVTCTTNLNLWLLPQHYQLWGTPWNANANALDTFSQEVPLFAPTASQTITQPAGTWVNIDGGLIFGTPSWLRFGALASTPDSAITRTGAGAFSLDTTTAGNGLGTLAMGGFTITGTSPTTGQCLTFSGTVWSTPVTCLTSSMVFYYQTVASNGVAQTQRPTLNFSPLFILSDSASPAETSVTVQTTGTATKFVTATAAGTSGNCTSWDASGNVADAGGPCLLSNTDQNFAVANAQLCTLAASTDSSCQVAISLPVAYADGNYTVEATMNAGGTPASGTDYPSLTVTINGTLLSTGFTVDLGCTFGCGSINQATHPFTLYVHTHHP